MMVASYRQAPSNPPGFNPMADDELNDNGQWTASDDGRRINSEDFTHDVSLIVTGDFWDDEQRKAYADNLTQKLNAGPERITMEHGRLIEMGQIAIIDHDGEPTEYKIALLIEFASVDELWQAVREGACTFGPDDDQSPNVTALCSAAGVINAQQARIDELMLEYCPDEMTPEQIENWERHQKTVPNV